jgi:hypothetical protein
MSRGTATPTAPSLSIRGLRDTPHLTLYIAVAGVAGHLVEEFARKRAGDLVACILRMPLDFRTMVSSEHRRRDLGLDWSA